MRRLLLLIFQSTLPQGEWLMTPWKTCTNTRFQSTLPQGEWLSFNLYWFWFQDFNPHSRKGSDGAYQMKRVGIYDFNPHSRKGSDMYSIVTNMRHKLFQSTLPQGEWHSWASNRKNRSYFNPHSRKGSDRKQTKNNQRQFYFNPHSRKGSDGFGDKPIAVFIISIHTPARGVTQSNDCIHGHWRNFNPHSRKGSDFNLQ